ncbi:MAG TPA: sigma-70 family RNA polymerase sigma factor [Acidimicrobiia bacterium]|nr:sigma-70 family RNA polymerase sigma factor [Acidimicrobiia bacterium]
MAVNGREVDWDTVVRDFTPRIRRLVARRLADAAAIEDVIQETFLKAYRRWSTYDSSQPLGPWLATIAANLCWERWQAAQQWADAAEAFDETPLPDYFGLAGSDEHVARLDREVAVHLALRRMTPRHRRVLYRWELERRSTAALAAIEDVSPEVLKATVVRARRNFREYFLAVAGEGPFAGVVVGLAGWLNRWREKANRVAVSGGNWVEASGAWVAAPVMAAAGMAMLAVAPTSTTEPMSPRPVAGQPVVAVHDAAPAVPSPEGPPVAASAPRSSAASTTSDSTASSSTSGLSVRAAAEPTVSTNPRNSGASLETDNPAAEDWRTFFVLTVQCDAGFTGRTACKMLDATGQ